jgi:hypothetical protein
MSAGKFRRREAIRMTYRLGVVLHIYNFKTKEDEAGSIKVHIQAELDSHTWALNKTREPQVNRDLSSMALSRENQKCEHRDKYIQTHNGLYEQKFMCTQMLTHMQTDADKNKCCPIISCAHV